MLRFAAIGDISRLQIRAALIKYLIETPAVNCSVSPGALVQGGLARTLSSSDDHGASAMA